MALFHSQMRRHMIKIVIKPFNSNLMNFLEQNVTISMGLSILCFKGPQEEISK